VQISNCVVCGKKAEYRIGKPRQHCETIRLRAGASGRID